MSDIKTFRDILTQLSSVKPPGVSGSRIRKLVDFALKHPKLQLDVTKTISEVSAECPATNKLGMMYALDAIARAFQDTARKHSDIEELRVGIDSFRKNIMEMMENMLIRNQSSEQFEKMKKLLVIWAKAGTFDSQTLDDIRAKYFYEPYTTTPPGSPPPEWAGLPPDTVKIQKKSVPDASAFLGVLQNLAQSKPTIEKPALDDMSDSKPNSLNTETNLDQSNKLTGSNTDDNNNTNVTQQGSQQGSQQGQQAGYQRGRSESRQMSHERNRSRSPSRQEPPESLQPKSRAGDATRNLKFDESLLPSKIMVLSRTLYVGTIPENYDEKKLREELLDIAPIQSLIFHREKRHAFVKAYNRADAEAIKKSYEQKNQNGDTAIKVKWGVGYGPRDCSDYYRGVSTIALMRLTDVDRKWAMSAEYGGTGGKMLEPGQVMEEPDIEIGMGGLSARNMHRHREQQMPPLTPIPGAMPAGFGDKGFPQQMPMVPGMMGAPFAMPGMPPLPDGMSMPPIPGAMPGAMPSMPGAMPGGMPPIPGAIPGGLPGAIPGGLPGAMPGAMPGVMPPLPGGMPAMPFPVMPMGPNQGDMQQFFTQMQQKMQENMQNQNK